MQEPPTPAQAAIEICDDYGRAVELFGEQSIEAEELRAMFFLACAVVRQLNG